MAIKGIGTSRATSNRPAVRIEFDDNTIATIAHADLTTFDTVAKLEAELVKQAPSKGDDLAQVILHINQDGSIAVATGVAPAVWPEDEPKE